MGLVQTISSYFYPPPHLSETNIRLKSQRLTLCIKQAQYKLQQQTYQHERILIQMMHDISRSQQGEKIRMELIIKNSEKLLIYDEIIICLNQIMKQSAILQSSPSKISNQCVIAINSIIFVYESMQLNQFVNLNQFIPSPHPQIPIEKTSPLIQKYLNEKSVSHYELNLYACQLAARNNAPNLSIFNVVGHNFDQNPIKPNQAMPSEGMWALTRQFVPEGQEMLQNKY